MDDHATTRVQVTDHIAQRRGGIGKELVANCGSDRHGATSGSMEHFTRHRNTNCRAAKKFTSIPASEPTATARIGHTRTISNA